MKVVDRTPKLPPDYWPLRMDPCPYCAGSWKDKRYSYCGKPSCRESHLARRLAERGEK